MELLRILVFGVLQLNLNWDYGRLVEIGNNHNMIRFMIGHNSFDDDYEYKLQILKDNLSLLTLEILDANNAIVVEGGSTRRAWTQGLYLKINMVFYFIIE